MSDEQMAKIQTLDELIYLIKSFDIDKLSAEDLDNLNWGYISAVYRKYNDINAYPIRKLKSLYDYLMDFQAVRDIKNLTWKKENKEM